MKYVLYYSVIAILMGCNVLKIDKQNVVLNKIPIETIDNYVDTLLVDTLINSLSIRVYYDGQEMMKHYGQLDKGENNQPTNQTIYEIASVTKTFVGTLIAQAEMEGKLSIEDDIRDYLSGDFDHLAYKNNPISIRHLLTHTGELPGFLPERIDVLLEQLRNELIELNEMNYELLFKISKLESSYSKDAFFADLMNVEIDTVPGNGYNYSNSSTELAAFILEKVYNKSFDEILEEKLCGRLNMADTRIRLNEEQKNRLANGYGGNGKTTPTVSTKLWGASGAMKSIISDMMSYIKFQLDDENEVVQKAQKVLYDKEVIYNDPNNKIGYFWLLNEDKALGRNIMHHGGAFGTQNFLILYPEIDLGITIITNQGDFQTSGKLMYVINGILNEIKKGL